MTELAKKNLKIAFASSNQTHLDEHFGSCRQLTIYSLSPESSSHLQTIEFISHGRLHPQKINDRLVALKDCFAVYCLACGNPVRQQLLAQGTRVVIISKAQLIDNLLRQIQANWPGEIASRQARQSMRKKETDYFAQLAESEWDDQFS